METTNNEKLIRAYFHMFSDEQWEEMKIQFPYSQIPFIVKECNLQTLKELEKTQNALFKDGQDFLFKENERLEALINSPEVNNFLEGVKIEAAHQTEKWGSEDEENKPPHHYILVFSKLLGKLAQAIFDGNTEKFKHHLITMAAACHNCHRQISKEGTSVYKWFNK